MKCENAVKIEFGLLKLSLVEMSEGKSVRTNGYEIEGKTRELGIYMRWTPVVHFPCTTSITTYIMTTVKSSAIWYGTLATNFHGSVYLFDFHALQKCTLNTIP